MKRKKHPTAAGFEPARVTPWDFKSHALTTRPNSLYILSRESQLALIVKWKVCRAWLKSKQKYLPMSEAQWSRLGTTLIPLAETGLYVFWSVS